MFERSHHQRIAEVLTALDADFLRAHHCLFGGGTAIVLLHGEYRESIDMDFLVSDLPCYRALRQKLNGAAGIQSMVRAGGPTLVQVGEVRADQYGIRTKLRVAEQIIKFEIVLEGRIQLVPSGVEDEICGVATLTTLDMLATKLLANADRWRDDGVFSRDLIDLAMVQPTRQQLSNAAAKAEQAYGDAVRNDLAKAIDSMKTRTGWLEHCMQVMGMNLPPAVVWQRIRRLTP